MKADAPRPVRAGEEIDAARLSAWLYQPVDSIEQFPRGHSNLTYLVKAGGRELVLRRPPFGSKVKSAHDMVREARILEKLHPVYPKAPKVVAVCEDVSVIGAQFYVMERIRGFVLRGADPQGLDMRALSSRFVDALVELHSVDYSKAGLTGKPEGYVRRQVEGWTRRWHDAKTDDIPDVDRAGAWLAERIPSERGAAFVHNDYKFDNMVLDDAGAIVGILDWEMSTVGDPLMDLGTALGYWIEAGDAEALKSFSFGPTFAEGAYTRDEIVQEYARRSGRDVSGMLFYYVFALFKTAVVLQQIYKRYKEGLTKDERFAALIFGVQLLAAQAAAAIDSGHI
jgi:aminoglycoside phosphotransferase (APT) family kinase protein